MTPRFGGPALAQGSPLHETSAGMRGDLTQLANRDPETRVFLTRALQLFKQAGIPVPVLSGGGTPALFNAQALPMLTEHRAGTYIYNDVMTVASGAATWADCAMQVRATVVSRPTDARAVIDAGTKVLTSDQYHVKGYGHLMEYPEAVVTGLSEEHGIVDLSGADSSAASIAACAASGATSPSWLVLPSFWLWANGSGAVPSGACASSACLISSSA